MKKLIGIFLLLSSICYSQTNELSFTGYYGTDIRNRPSVFAGVSYEIAVTERISLNYNFKLGSTSENRLAFQSPMGAFGGSMLFFWGLGDDEDFYTLGILACFIPEGITINFPFDDTKTISTYINPLALEYTSNRISSMIECGVKLKKYLNDDSFVSLNFGLKSNYNQSLPIGFIGGSMGIKID